jgi:hypothetical protein
MKYFLTAAILIFSFYHAQAQVTGKISGYVRDARTQEALVGATVAIVGTTLGSSTDVNGYYTIASVATKTYTIAASLVGYKTLQKFDIVITSGNTVNLNFDLEETTSQLSEVEVTASPFVKLEETPNSIQSLGQQEIKSYPGGNNDIAKVVQSLPGVSGSVGFRNDVIIRGGAPNENVYYLDGVEIPNINHFATQGSAGGPVGMLNVSFIENVTLTTSSFPARYDNPLSGVLQFKQRTGNEERNQGNFRLGASEVAGTLEGPLLKGKRNTTYIISLRRSYLQFLFKLIDLPFLPSYWDYQYKVTHKFDNKNEISLIGLGSIDKFKLNPPKEASLEQLAILDGIPVNSQWSSTIGLTWKRLVKNGYFQMALSGNYLNNEADKFDDNDEGNESKRRFRYRSVEDENKLRLEMNKFKGGWSFSYGGSAIHSRYTNATFNKLRNEVRDPNGNILQPGITIDYNSAISFYKFGAFTQVSRRLFKDQLNLSFGIRSDINTFLENGLNPLETLSPRLSASYALTPSVNINASAGRYYKIPPYTILGYRASDDSRTLLNKNNQYIRSDHLVAGLEFLPTSSTRITIEGFYKRYDNYPVSIQDSISLANLGGNFGVLGNEQTAGAGLGKTYGLEFFFQQKLTKNFYGVLAYTYYFSKFTGFDRSQFIPSAWDNRHLITFTGGYKFGRNWELGARFRYLGSAPYTPYDIQRSLYNYSVSGGGTLDYGRFNTERLPAFNAMDLRVDKKWNFKKWALDVYLDIQNVYSSTNESQPGFTLQRNPDNSIATTSGQPYDPANPTDAIPVILSSDDGAALPTIGLIVEF